MLWRVRTTLPDRPGALAVLAKRCGDAGVNILSVQVFPGVEAVTDEFVLRTPDDWGTTDLAGLIEGAGGFKVSLLPVTEAALADQPTRYVQAARRILAQPASFPEVVAGLFDAEADPPDPSTAAVLDVMEMTLEEVQVQVRRTAPFTATEHARGAAMAELVSDVLARAKTPSPLPQPGRRVASSAVPVYQAEGDVVTATVDGTVVGSATLHPQTVEAGVREMTLGVDPAWQRRGIGTRLLMEAARLASARGASEMRITTRADNQAVLPMVLSAGLRGRIRMAADQLTVRVPVRELKPLQR